MPATESARRVTTPPSAPRATTAAPRAVPALAALALATALSLGQPVAAQVGGPIGPGDPTPTTTEKPTTTEGPTTTEKPDRPTTTTEAADDPTPTTEAAPTDPAGPPRADVDEAEGEASGEPDDGGSSAVGLVLVGLAGLVLGLLLAGVPLGAALSRRKAAAPVDRTPVPLAPAPNGPAPGAAPSATPGSGPATATVAAGPVIGPAPTRGEAELRTQRALLIEGLVALRDKLPSAALGEEAGRILAGAGVVEIRPEGQPFDAAVHRAVDQAATDDPAHHNVIVGVERPGYADGPHVIRQPEVVVARADGRP